MNNDSLKELYGSLTPKGVETIWDHMKEHRRFINIEEEAKYWLSNPKNDGLEVPDRLRGTRAVNEQYFGCITGTLVDQHRYNVQTSGLNKFVEQMTKPLRTPPPPNIDGDAWQKRLDDLQDRLEDARNCIRAQEATIEELTRNLNYNISMVAEFADVVSRTDDVSIAAQKIEVDLSKVERAIGSIKFKEIVEGP